MVTRTHTNPLLTNRAAVVGQTPKHQINVREGEERLKEERTSKREELQARRRERGEKRGDEEVMRNSGMSHL